MRNLLIVSFSIILSLTHSISVWGESNSPILSYQLEVHIDPFSHQIQGKAKILNPPASYFYLNDNLEVHRVLADGKPVSFYRDSSAKPLPYSVGKTVAVAIHSATELQIDYSGSIPQIINGVNVINADLVELACYSSWYPIFRDTQSFQFTLKADLPSGFIAVSNGVLKKLTEKENRSITQWKSAQPDIDIALLASPHLQKVEENQNNSKLEIYFSQMSHDTIEIKKDHLKKALDRLSNLYSAPQLNGLLCFVYSPRSGWGYSRIPLIVVSEEYAMAEIQKPFGQARDFHGGAHEMAHFWWRIANTSTPDDWINEGLAEFSAFRLSQEQFGQEFADRLITEYREHAAESKTETPIVKTESDSDDRYVNRYEKTTLLFLEAQKRFGQESLDRFLKSFYTLYAGTRNATTQLFLDEVEKLIGVETKDFFQCYLFAKKWNGEFVTN